MADTFLDKLAIQVTLEGVYLPSTFKDTVVRQVRLDYLRVDNAIWKKKHAQQFGRILKQLKQLQLFSVVSGGNVFPPISPHHLGLSVPWMVLQIATGNNFTLFLLETQQVVGVGRSYFGELGMKCTDHQTRVLEELPRARFVAAGHSSAYAIAAETNRMYAWGCPADGRLGVGRPQQAYPDTICMSPSLESFSKVSAGSAHAVGISTSRYLFSWGMGQYNGFHRIQYLPKKLMEGKCIDAVCAVSGYHTICLMANGCVWGFGHNAMYAMGLPERRLYTKPTRLPFAAFEINQIAAGWAHTVLHRTKGGFVVAGRNENGQCNRSLEVSTMISDDNTKVIAVVPTYVCIEGVPDDGYAICGGSSTAIVTNKGTWTFGSNYKGHLFRECDTFWDHHAVKVDCTVVAQGYSMAFAIS